MKFLVTGGAGFIGSNLVDLLVEEGHEVHVWDSFTTGVPDKLSKKATWSVVDVGAFNPRDHASQCSNYEVIFHLAAEARIQPSFQFPHKSHNSNTNGTANVLEFARITGSKVVYAGSSSFYGGVYKNPYTFTKWLGEEYCKMYHNVFNVQTAIARFFNVYGPRHVSDGPYATVLAIFERQKKEGLPLTVTGDGEQRRDFTHVNDIVIGLRAISAFHSLEAQVFNFGSGRNHSINEVAKLFQPSSIEYLPARPGEARDTLADIEATCNLLGWTPQQRLEDYIAEYVSGLNS